MKGGHDHYEDNPLESVHRNCWLHCNVEFERHRYDHILGSKFHIHSLAVSFSSNTMALRPDGAAKCRQCDRTSMAQAQATIAKPLQLDRSRRRTQLGRAFSGNEVVIDSLVMIAASLNGAGCSDTNNAGWSRWGACAVTRHV